MLLYFHIYLLFCLSLAYILFLVLFSFLQLLFNLFFHILFCFFLLLLLLLFFLLCSGHVMGSKMVMGTKMFPVPNVSCFNCPPPNLLPSRFWLLSPNPILSLSVLCPHLVLSFFVSVPLRVTLPDKC